jgi:membrane protein
MEEMRHLRRKTALPHRACPRSTAPCRVSMFRPSSTGSLPGGARRCKPLERLMVVRQSRTVVGAFYALYADSGFAMAGAVAFSFVLSLFPFCIFLGAVAGLFGGEALAKQGVERLFEIAPAPVAQALAPEVMAVMGRSRFDLLTYGALISLFFATSAIESLRTALNVAYRRKEKSPYFVSLLKSTLFVILSAVGVLVLTWGVVVGPEMAARIKPDWLLWLADEGWLALIVRFAIVIGAIGVQLLAYHLWLAAGRRSLADVWPGVLLSIVLWIIAARLFSYWLTFTDYSRFYAGLASIMSALVFFQVSAIIVILGAELNRGLLEIKERRAGGGNGN